MLEVLNEHQAFEQAWWDTCANTYGEETKQITYAKRMGLTAISHEGKWPVYDLIGKSVLDLGGGPVSMLIKTINGTAKTVVDPCAYPDWVRARYEAAEIAWYQAPAETWWNDMQDHARDTGTPSMQMHWDECWIYNVLQHVIDPEKVLASAWSHGPGGGGARLLRIFEWLETPQSIGHPHTLHLNEMNAWIGREGGKIESMNENGCVGLAYYGVFA